MRRDRATSGYFCQRVSTTSNVNTKKSSGVNTKYLNSGNITMIGQILQLATILGEATYLIILYLAGTPCCY